MSHSSHFWNFIAERYSRSPVPNEDIYQKKLAATQRYLQPNMTVLEFGCGTGSTALVHAPLVKKYIALDVSSKMLTIAQQKQAKSDVKNIEFKQSAIEQWPEPSEGYDAILGLSILHLLNKPDEVIEKLYRMLKPGGLLITSTACIGGKMPFMHLLLPLGHLLGVLPKVQFFDRDALEVRINQAGFRTEFLLQEAEATDARFLISVKTDQ